MSETSKSLDTITAVDLTFPAEETTAQAVNLQAAAVALSAPAAIVSPSAPEPPVVNAAPATAEPATLATNVEVVQATGERRLAGRGDTVATVKLPLYNVMIGGRLAARTSLNVNKPIMTVAEVLPEEETAIIVAVAAVRSDTEPVEVRRPPKSSRVEAFLASKK